MSPASARKTDFRQLGRCGAPYSSDLTKQPRMRFARFDSLGPGGVVQRDGG